MPSGNKPLPEPMLTVDLISEVFCGIHLGAISNEVIFRIMNVKIILLKSLPYLPRSNELNDDNVDKGMSKAAGINTTIDYSLKKFKLNRWTILFQSKLLLVTFESKYNNFHSRKCILNKMLSAICQPFCPGLNILTHLDRNKMAAILQMTFLIAFCSMKSCNFD